MLDFFWEKAHVTFVSDNRIRVPQLWLNMYPLFSCIRVSFGLQKHFVNILNRKTTKRGEINSCWTSPITANHIYTLGFAELEINWWLPLSTAGSKCDNIGKGLEDISIQLDPLVNILQWIYCFGVWCDTKITWHHLLKF